MNVSVVKSFKYDYRFSELLGRLVGGSVVREFDKTQEKTCLG